MKRLRIVPYNLGSESARLIKNALGGLRVRLDSRTYRPRLRHLVVNWGSARKPAWWTTGLNNPDAVAKASDKLVTLSNLRQQGVRVPDFTTRFEDMRQWLREGHVVVGRKVLNGHGGVGCVIMEPVEMLRERGANEIEDGYLVSCPLYTKHVRHKHEYRVHVFKGKVIDEVAKLKKSGVEDRNPWIRSHDNGYIFARHAGPIPEQARQEAIKAVQALGLDFGAVDIAYRAKEGLAFVLEINTAPGIEGTTVTKYVEALREEMGR